MCFAPDWSEKPKTGFGDHCIAGSPKPAPQPPLLSSWPIGRLPGWVDPVNSPLSEGELSAVRLSARRGKPLGDDGWVEAIARRINLESTMRPRGRRRIRFPQAPIKEA
jgi:putative transposase